MNEEDIPFIVAWHEAKERDWQAPPGFCRDCVKDLSGGDLPPLKEVIDLLAFGRTTRTVGLSDIEMLTRRLTAARRLFKAAAFEDVEFFGRRCELLKLRHADGTPIAGGPMGPPLLRSLSLVARRIDPQEFVGDRLTLCPLNWTWISLASVAADPEIWQRAESVRYSDVTIDQRSLGEWIEELTGTVATAQTGRPKGTPLP
jgi:hypothetical protein